jgi:hypothetical protein
VSLEESLQKLAEETRQDVVRDSSSARARS